MRCKKLLRAWLTAWSKIGRFQAARLVRCKLAYGGSVHWDRKRAGPALDKQPNKISDRPSWLQKWAKQIAAAPSEPGQRGQDLSCKPGCSRPQTNRALSVITPNELFLIKFDKNRVKLSHFLSTNTTMGVFVSAYAARLSQKHGINLPNSRRSTRVRESRIAG